MPDVVFEDYSVQVKTEIRDKALKFLNEAGGLLRSQAADNSRVRSGQTRSSFQHQVDESSLACHVGSNYQNAIWEEFGTGIYAVNGDGRKTPWVYKDAKGQFHRTQGKSPNRALFNAFTSLKGKLQQLAESAFGEIG